MSNAARLSVIATFLLSNVPAFAACLSYEPASVTLSGKVEIADAYGPPGFGDNPAHDTKKRYPVLLLDSPICVTGDPKDELNSESEDDVKRVQLVFLDGKIRTDLLHKEASITGTLFHAETGHHHTAVLIQVSSAQMR
jgi:hypothetical protein